MVTFNNFHFSQITIGIYVLVLVLVLCLVSVYVSVLHRFEHPHVTIIVCVKVLSKSKQVHQTSLDAASSLLVAALNKGRDVILDGTLSWEPFMEQTIAMARNVHEHHYRMGVGYKVAEDGTITENYWEQVNEVEAEEENQPEQSHKKEPHTRMPYKIELVGVVCDGYLAVIRGIRCIYVHIYLW